MIHVYRVILSLVLLMAGMVIILFAYQTMAWIFTNKFYISYEDKVACGIIGFIFGIVLIVAANWKRFK